MHGRPLGPRRIAVALACALALGLPCIAPAQQTPPNPPGFPTATAPPTAPTASPEPGPSASPAVPGTEGTVPAATPVATPAPTQPPIVVDPASVGVEPGRVAAARVNSALGTIAATVADPAIASVVADTVQRRIFITGIKLGRTVVTVRDDRGLARDVPVLVAYAAGTVADDVPLQLTGNPASSTFVREAAIRAAIDAVVRRPGARVDVYPDDVRAHDLRPNASTEVDVPVAVSGDGYFTVQGVSHVRITDRALPPIVASQLLVSDYPEKLTADGVLFDATLDRTAAQRFLYFHFNPPGAKPRRIVLKARNTTARVATVQVILGMGGPTANEMEVGHNATRSFLVREQRNEGEVTTIPAGATVNLVIHDAPTNGIVSALMQLREIDGDPLELTLVAQDAQAPLDQAPETTALLAGGAIHARGVYPVPSFSFDATYTIGSDPLEIPIGQLPLPNLRQGETLSGDYGVEQRIRVVFVNPSRAAQPVAIYANPRGGRATGTFLIDDTLVQAHGLAPFSRYKIWQETIGPNVYRTVTIVTIPEGGSSYPLRLVFGSDDGSVAPGGPGSPIY